MPVSRSKCRTLLAALLLIPALTGCRSGPRPLVFDSEPPGASVVIDGVPSGFATPCVMQLDDKRSRTVEFVLPGYRTEARELRLGERSVVVYYNESTSGYRTFRFPLFLNVTDFTFPIKEDDGEMPRRIHVRLIREPDRIALGFL